MRNLTFVILIIIVLTGISPIQAQSDHLRPVNSIFDDFTFEFDYHSKVRKVLFNGLTDYPEISFLSLPSFSPENALIIEYDRENEKYFIIYQTCGEMIWENKNWQKVKVSTYRNEITKNSVQLIKSLFSNVISQIKYPADEDLRPDGVYYYFSVLDSVQKSGKIKSPDDGTKMGRLVNIGYSLIELAQKKASIVELNATLKAEIETLTEK